MERWNFQKEKKKVKEKKRDEITLWNLHVHLLTCTPLCKNAGGANVSCLLWKGQPALSVTRDRLVQCAVSGVILSYGNAAAGDRLCIRQPGISFLQHNGEKKLARCTQSVNYMDTSLSAFPAVFIAMCHYSRGVYKYSSVLESKILKDKIYIY